MPFIDKLLEWENDEVMGENGNCFGILERRQGKSRDGLPKLRRLQVVCIALFFVEGQSPNHPSAFHLTVPGPTSRSNKEGLAGLQNLLHPSGSAGGCHERLPGALGRDQNWRRHHFLIPFVS